VKKEKKETNGPIFHFIPFRFVSLRAGIDLDRAPITGAEVAFIGRII